MASLSDYIDDPRFSKTFELPTDQSPGRDRPFKVKYADYGYRNEANPEEEYVFLFFGSMMGSRLVHIAKDEMAKQHKIRMIDVDRPGVGGTDPADAKHVMNLWREVILALLRHLGIRHVSIGCHSGGTVSALDMVLHHPELLHPERPYLAIGAPWILPSHTSSTILSVVQRLPTAMIGKFDKLTRIHNDHISPSVGACVGFGRAVVAKLSPTSSKKDDERSQEKDVEFEEKLWPLIMKRIYSDSVRGISSDALLFMQKADGISGWSDWGDYDTLVPRLTETLRTLVQRLRVDVFFAESDIMIGEGGSKGPLWFDQCWSKANCGDVIEYHSTIIKGADHDFVWNRRWDAIQQVFGRISQPVEPLSAASWGS